MLARMLNRGRSVPHTGGYHPPSSLLQTSRRSIPLRKGRGVRLWGEVGTLQVCFKRFVPAGLISVFDLVCVALELDCSVMRPFARVHILSLHPRTETRNVGRGKGGERSLA